MAGEDRYSAGANPQFWAQIFHCPVATGGTRLRDRQEVKRMVACPDRGAEREPDDMFRSQTVVSDSREGAG